MKASVAFIRGVLSVVYDQAVAGNVPLIDALKGFRNARFDKSTSGRFLIASMDKGTEVKYAIPTPDRMTQVDLFELGQFLVDLYTLTVTELGGTPADADVYAEMMTKLIPVTRMQTSFLNIAK